MRKKILTILIPVLVLLLSGTVFACSAVVTVDFDTNGGVETISTQFLSRGSKAKIPTSPTRTGYTFDGWFANKSLTKKFNFSTDRVRKNLVLYAGWRTNNYTLSFVTEGSQVDDIVAPFASTPELFESYLTGFVFDGWFTDAECTAAFDGVVPAGNLTLYAGWTISKDYSAFTFEKNSVGYTLTSVRDIKLNLLTVPDTYANLPVTRIGKAAFKQARQMQSVEIPQSVTAIEESAFEGMTALKVIKLPALEFVSARMFYGCELLSDVELSDTVQAIGVGAFYGCTSLTEIKLPAALKVMGARAFSGSGLTEVTLPKSLTIVDLNAFYGCADLSAVNFLGEVKQILEGAFENAISLKKIELPPSLEVLGARAFACSGLTEIALPKGLKSAGDYLFYGCESLVRAEIKGAPDLGGYVFFDCVSLSEVTLAEGLQSLGESMFENCRALSEITLPTGLVGIGAAAFKNCILLNEIALPAGVTIVPQSAFENCSSLKKAVLPEDLTAIGESAFDMCVMLDEINLPQNIVSIGFRAFFNCEKLNNLEFGDSLKTVGRNAFLYTGWQNSQSGNIYVGRVLYRAESSGVVIKEGTVGIADYAFSDNRVITLLDLPDTLEYIGEGAFYGCNLTELVLPSSLKQIGVNAFRNNRYLAKIIFPENDGSGGEFVLEGLGAGAFRGCAALKEIKLPKTENLGAEVFMDCAALTKIELSASLKEVPQNMFSGCISLKSIRLPAAKSIGRGAFFGAKALSEVTLSEELKTIGQSAFEDCAALTELTLPESLENIMSFAFRNSALSRVTIGGKVEMIGEQAFFSTRSSTFNTLEPIGLTVILKGSPLLGMSAFSTGEQLKIIAAHDFYTEIKTESFRHAAYENWKTYKSYVYNFDLNEDGFILDAGRLVAYVGRDSRVVIPEAVSEIAPFVFYSCGFIKEAELNESLKTIGDYAFFGTGISRLSLGKNIASIGKKAFFVKSYLYSVDVATVDFSTPPAALGENAFKIAGYHSVSLGSVSLYRFGENKDIYDEAGELAVLTDGELSEAEILFEAAMAKPLSMGIIRLEKSILTINYRIYWQEYSQFITS